LDFAQLVERCVETARVSHHLPPTAIRYQSSLNGSGSEVNGDAEDLSTAVSNILDNAVKYSGNQVDVSVHLDLIEQKRLVLRVQDRGVGIPHSELKTIFKRFYRVPNRALAQVRGTGLGLFLVRSVAKRHGGRVTAESPGEGKGATVTLELPRRIS
jgi:signal transduction histidine kinase